MSLFFSLKIPYFHFFLTKIWDPDDTQTIIFDMIENKYKIIENYWKLSKYQKILIKILIFFTEFYLKILIFDRILSEILIFDRINYVQNYWKNQIIRILINFWKFWKILIWGPNYDSYTVVP